MVEKPDSTENSKQLTADDLLKHLYKNTLPEIELRKPKKFRIRSKKLFLTYSQIPPINSDIRQVFLEILKNQLAPKASLRKYLISMEKHADGNNHLHIFLEYDRKCDFGNRKHFAVDLSSHLSEEWLNDKKKSLCEGHYVSAKNKHALIRYITKDETADESSKALTNFEVPSVTGEYYEKAEDHLFAFMQVHGIYATTELLYSNYPEIAVRKGSVLLNNLKLASDYYSSKKLEASTVIKPYKDFVNIPSETEIQEWMTAGYQKTCLVLHGPSRTGKTEFAKSLMHHYNLKFLFCRSTETLKDYNPILHSGIIFDDLEMDECTRQGRVHLLDVENASQIRILYGTSTLMPKTHRIFTSNVPQDFIRGEQSGELSRRVTFVRVPKPMYSITYEKTVIEKIKITVGENDENPHNYTTNH